MLQKKGRHGPRWSLRWPRHRRPSAEIGAPIGVLAARGVGGAIGDGRVEREKLLIAKSLAPLVLVGTKKCAHLRPGRNLTMPRSRAPIGGKSAHGIGDD